MSTPIVIDCDPGHDDAIAILLALASPEVEVMAVTTVAGNQTVDKTTRNALQVLELAGRPDIPVAAGADRPLRRSLRLAQEVHGESGLNGIVLPDPSSGPLDVPACELLDRTIRLGVVLVATGPLTNVASLLAAHPDVADRLGSIVWMGGSCGAGNVTPSAEFNAFVDPEAASLVFASGIEVTMVGLDVTRAALFRRSHAERLRGGGRVGRFVAEMSDSFFPRYERRYGPSCAPLHDALAVAEVIDPGVVTTVAANVEIETRSMFCDGRTVVDLGGVTARAPNARVGVDVDPERFLGLLCSRLEVMP